MPTKRREYGALRILHLLPSLSSGGAERQFGYLAPELVKMGHRVDVAYLSTGPAMPNLSGVSMHHLAARSNHDPSLLWQLIRLAQRIKPDIIHTWILQMDILGGITAKAARVPWILREPSSEMAYPSTLKNRLRVLAGAGASAIVANSCGGVDYWKVRLPLSQRYIVRNGLPVDEIESVKPAVPKGLPEPEVPVLLYVGRLESGRSATKNLEAFFQAFACILKQQKVVGILCGDGPQRPELEALRHKLGLDSDIHFTGHLPAASVWALMKRASVFVSLSAYEGCPNTVMEAMACGCPLVISDIPAHREILDETGALFVDPSNIRHVADTIAMALSDQAGSKARALAAKQKARKWSISEMAEGYEKVYKELTQARISGNVHARSVAIS